MNKLFHIIIIGIFYAPLVYSDIERVSVSSSGEQGNYNSFNGSLSTDGRYLAFGSISSNFVDGDTNEVRDVFVKDFETNAIERVSVSSSGEQGNRTSQSPVISGDGRFVAFRSVATNLVNNDTNGDSQSFVGQDVFVHDRVTGITKRVNISSTGEQANKASEGTIRLSISEDGRIIAFLSAASNLVDNDVNFRNDVFIHDLLTGTTEIVSVSTTGEKGSNASSTVSLSADGRFVGFTSNSNNLVNSDNNFEWIRDAYIHDRQTGITELVSISTNGTQANHHSYVTGISADGRHIAFTSFATNLVSNDTAFGYLGEDMFVHDRLTGTTNRVNVSTFGEEANSNADGTLFNRNISDDGRFVTFATDATNLVTGDTNANEDVFVHDLDSGITERISVLSNGTQGNGRSAFPSISGDGRVLVFYSTASNLVDSDTNNYSDVFIVDNPLINSPKKLLTVAKLINNSVRPTQATAAKLVTGTQYQQSYSITNNSPNRIYQVKVFEDGNLACNFYALNPGQTKQRCNTYQTVIDGNQHAETTVTAKISGSGEQLVSKSDAYYTGLTNISGKLQVTHRVLYKDRYYVTTDNAISPLPLDSPQANFLFKVENTGEIELYKVKTYHDSVTPINGGWMQQCNIGSLKPGQVRYCNRDYFLSEPGTNQIMGRAQGTNAFVNPTDVINASNPTYINVP